MTSDRLKPHRDYSIGRGRPPKHTRWKPGQSGNLRGRPKGSKNLNVLLNAALKTVIKIQENGKMRKVSIAEAIVRRTVNEALKGNLKTTSFIFNQAARFPKEPAPEREITSDMTMEEAAAAYAATLNKDC